MMLPPRIMQQPGPAILERIVTVAAQGRGFEFDLEAGVPLLENIRRGFAAEGFTSGVVEMTDMSLGPFAYVIPALSTDGLNAAFYSDIFRPDGTTLVSRAAMTFGLRNGAPHFHCHGLWLEADGKHSGGHMLPEETVVARPVRVAALGLSGATFAAEPDPEINFTVFGPVPSEPSGVAATRVLAVRLRPNQDFHAAIREAAATHDIRRGRIRGGVGSTIGCIFDDGRIMPNFATELYIAGGAIDGQDVWVDVGVIDYTGAIARGRLKAGHNPVLMTFELVIEATQ